MRAPTAVAAMLLLPAAAAAQTGDPEPRALGLGDNYTALARGFAAPAWNPAGLGMPDNPDVTVTLLPARAALGLEPVTPSDLADYDGRIVPRDVKLAWLDAIRRDGGESGSVDADLTFLALSVGHFALSASTTMRGRVNTAPDVAELLLFGNAGLTGEPGEYTLSGSRFDAAAVSTVAASFGLPLSLTLGPLPDQHFAVGITFKYTMGNFLLSAHEDGSTLTASPPDVVIRFPVVSTPMSDSADSGDLFNNGSGIGVDVGAAWQGGIFSAGLVVKNLINTFEWDPSSLEFRAGEAVWTADTSYTSFDVVGDGGSLPGDVARRIDRLYSFAPVLAAGATARVLPYLTVTGDVRHAFDDDLQVGARTHLGVGAELTVLPVLPLRAGLAAISGGYQLGGGLGLVLGPVSLAASAAARSDDYGGETVLGLGLSLVLR